MTVTLVRHYRTAGNPGRQKLPAVSCQVDVLANDSGHGIGILSVDFDPAYTASGTVLLEAIDTGDHQYEGETEPVTEYRVVYIAAADTTGVQHLTYTMGNGTTTVTGQIQVTVQQQPLESFGLLRDTGDSDTDGITSDATLTGMLQRAAGTTSLTLEFDVDGDDVMDVTQVVNFDALPDATGFEDFASFNFTPTGLAVDQQHTVQARVGGTEPTDWQSVTFDLVAATAPDVSQWQYSTGWWAADQNSDPDGEFIDTSEWPQVLMGQLVASGHAADTGSLLVEIDYDDDGIFDASPPEATTWSDSEGRFEWQPFGLSGVQYVRARSVITLPDDSTVAGAWSSTLTVDFGDLQAAGFASITLTHDLGLAGEPPEGEEDPVANWESTVALIEGSLGDTPLAAQDFGLNAVEGMSEGTTSEEYLGLAGVIIEVDHDADGTPEAQIQTDDWGNFSYLATGLATGTHTLRLRTVTQTDAGDLTSDWSSVTFTLHDAAVPPREVVSFGLLRDTGVSDSDTITSDATLTGQLHADDPTALSRVQFDHNGDSTFDGETSLNSDGSFIYLPVGISAGPNAIRTRVLQWDPATEALVAGAWSAAYTFTLNPDADDLDIFWWDSLDTGNTENSEGSSGSNGELDPIDAAYNQSVQTAADDLDQARSTAQSDYDSATSVARQAYDDAVAAADAQLQTDLQNFTGDTTTLEDIHDGFGWHAMPASVSLPNTPPPPLPDNLANQVVSLGLGDNSNYQAALQNAQSSYANALSAANLAFRNAQQAAQTTYNQAVSKADRDLTAVRLREAARLATTVKANEASDPVLSAELRAINGKAAAAVASLEEEIEALQAEIAEVPSVSIGWYFEGDEHLLLHPDGNHIQWNDRLIDSGNAQTDFSQRREDARQSLGDEYTTAYDAWDTAYFNLPEDDPNTTEDEHGDAYQLNEDTFREAVQSAEVEFAETIHAIDVEERAATALHRQNLEDQLAVKQELLKQQRNLAEKDRSIAKAESAERKAQRLAEAQYHHDKALATAAEQHAKDVAAAEYDRTINQTDAANTRRMNTHLAEKAFSAARLAEMESALTAWDSTINSPTTNREVELFNAEKVLVENQYNDQTAHITALNGKVTTEVGNIAEADRTEAEDNATSAKARADKEAQAKRTLSRELAKTELIQATAAAGHEQTYRDKFAEARRVLDIADSDEHVIEDGSVALAMQTFRDAEAGLYADHPAQSRFHYVDDAGDGVYDGVYELSGIDSSYFPDTTALQSTRDLAVADAAHTREMARVGTGGDYITWAQVRTQAMVTYHHSLAEVADTAAQQVADAELAYETVLAAEEKAYRTDAMNHSETAYNAGVAASIELQEFDAEAEKDAAISEAEDEATLDKDTAAADRNFFTATAAAWKAQVDAWAGWVGNAWSTYQQSVAAAELDETNTLYTDPTPGDGSDDPSHHESLITSLATEAVTLATDVANAVFTQANSALTALQAKTTSLVNAAKTETTEKINADHTRRMELANAAHTQQVADSEKEEVRLKEVADDAKVLQDTVDDAEWARRKAVADANKDFAHGTLTQTQKSAAHTAAQATFNTDKAAAESQFAIDAATENKVLVEAQADHLVTRVTAEQTAAATHSTTVTDAGRAFTDTVYGQVPTITDPSDPNYTPPGGSDPQYQDALADADNTLQNSQNTAYKSAADANALARKGYADQANLAATTRAEEQRDASNTYRTQAAQERVEQWDAYILSFTGPIVNPNDSTQVITLAQLEYQRDRAIADREWTIASVAAEDAYYNSTTTARQNQETALADAQADYEEALADAEEDYDTATARQQQAHTNRKSGNRAAADFARDQQHAQLDRNDADSGSYQTSRLGIVTAAAAHAKSVIGNYTSWVTTTAPLVNATDYDPNDPNHDPTALDQARTDRYDANATALAARSGGVGDAHIAHADAKGNSLIAHVGAYNSQLADYVNSTLNQPTIDPQLEIDRQDAEQVAERDYIADRYAAENAFRTAEEQPWITWETDKALADKDRDIAYGTALATYYETQHGDDATAARTIANQTGSTTEQQHAAALAEAQQAWSESFDGHYITYVTATAEADRVQRVALLPLERAREDALRLADQVYEIGDVTDPANPGGRLQLQHDQQDALLLIDQAYEVSSRSAENSYQIATLAADATRRTATATNSQTYAKARATVNKDYHVDNPRNGEHDDSYYSTAYYASFGTADTANTTAIAGYESAWLTATSNADRDYQKGLANADYTLTFNTAEQDRLFAVADAQLMHAQRDLDIQAETTYQRATLNANETNGIAHVTADAALQAAHHTANVAAYTDLDGTLTLPWTEFKQLEATAYQQAWDDKQADFLADQTTGITEQRQAKEGAIDVTGSIDLAATRDTAINDAELVWTMASAEGQAILSKALALITKTAVHDIADATANHHQQPSSSDYVTEVTTIQEAANTAAETARSDYQQHAADHYVGKDAQGSDPAIPGYIPVTAAAAEKNYGDALADKHRDLVVSESARYHAFTGSSFAILENKLNSVFTGNTSPWSEKVLTKSAAKTTFTTTTTAAAQTRDVADADAQRDQAKAVNAAVETRENDEAAAAVTELATPDPETSSTPQPEPVEQPYTPKFTSNGPEDEEKPEEESEELPDYRNLPFVNFQGEPEEIVPVDADTDPQDPTSDEIPAYMTKYRLEQRRILIAKFGKELGLKVFKEVDKRDRAAKLDEFQSELTALIRQSEVHRKQELREAIQPFRDYMLGVSIRWVLTEEQRSDLRYELVANQLKSGLQQVDSADDIEPSDKKNKYGLAHGTIAVVGDFTSSFLSKFFQRAGHQGIRRLQYFLSESWSVQVVGDLLGSQGYTVDALTRTIRVSARLKYRVNISGGSRVKMVSRTRAATDDEISQRLQNALKHPDVLGVEQGWKKRWSESPQHPGEYKYFLRVDELSRLVSAGIPKHDEIYDQFDLLYTQRKLPLPSSASVENLKNRWRREAREQHLAEVVESSKIASTFVMIGASFYPGVGEAWDAAILSDPNASIVDKSLSRASLFFSAITGGVLPNYGALRGLRYLDEGADLVRAGAHADGAFVGIVRQNASEATDEILDLLSHNPADDIFAGLSNVPDELRNVINTTDELVNSAMAGARGAGTRAARTVDEILVGGTVPKRARSGRGGFDEWLEGLSEAEILALKADKHRVGNNCRWVVESLVVWC